MYTLNTQEIDRQRIREFMNSYGVFCIAMAHPERNERELDLMWEESIGLYEEFLVSDFNDWNYSELDCINTFMMHKFPKVNWRVLTGRNDAHVKYKRVKDAPNERSATR